MFVASAWRFELPTTSHYCKIEDQASYEVLWYTDSIEIQSEVKSWPNYKCQNNQKTLIPAGVVCHRLQSSARVAVEFTPTQFYVRDSPRSIGQWLRF